MKKLFLIVTLLSFVFVGNAFCLNTYYNNKSGYNNQKNYDNKSGYDNKIPYRAFFNDVISQELNVQKGNVQAVIKVNQKEETIGQKKGVSK